MVDIKCYVCPIPDNDQTRGQQSQQLDNALAGLLGQDDSSAERVSSPPGEQRIVAQYKGRYADIMGAEIGELAESSGYAEVPLYVVGAKAALDGYYLVDRSDVGPADPRERRIQDVDLRLSRAGSRASHYRAVQTDRRQTDHPFGNDTTREVGIPAAATEVYWVNPETGAATDANPAATRNAELGDVAVYDAETAPVQEPVLVYDAAYSAAGPVDVRCWDTRGYPDRDDADGLPQWSKVFVSTHDFGGDPLEISTGLLRVRLDPSSSPGITAETWDDANSTWTDKALGTSSWQLTAVDVGHRTDQSLSPARVDALTRWTDGSSTYSLDMNLQRGHESVLFDRVPSATTGVPVGLEDLLAPIASPSLLDARPAQTLRPRSEVTRA